MARRQSAEKATAKTKIDPVVTLKDEVTRLALEGARRALVAAQPRGEAGEELAPGEREADTAREREQLAIAATYVEIAERARNLDEPF